MKISFYNDYSEGAHPQILAALAQLNQEQFSGYGQDRYSQEAASLIKQAVGNDSAQVHFVVGGTQANQLALAAMLKPYQAVIAAETGHINVHEAGAIEATGHKIITTAHQGGKISVKEIVAQVEAHTDEHMVMPKAVFISQATELGTLYSLAELTEISNFCRTQGLYLYVDGARLASALMGENSSVDLPALGRLADAFYIGGTKNGFLCGEAMVLINPELQENFRYHMKQRGALLAKGSILGIQFQTAFVTGLYFEMAKHANEMASNLRAGIKAVSYEFLVETTTNQVFPIFPIELINKLEQEFGFYVWEKVSSDKAAIRLVTSWATSEDSVERFLQALSS